MTERCTRFTGSVEHRSAQHRCHSEPLIRPMITWFWDALQVDLGTDAGQQEVDIVRYGTTGLYVFAIVSHCQLTALWNETIINLSLNLMINEVKYRKSAVISAFATEAHIYWQKAILVIYDRELGDCRELQRKTETNLVL